MTFKTNCPKCGGKKKLSTKVQLLGNGALTYSKAKCYKCGFYSRAGSCKPSPLRATWTPPSGGYSTEP